ncbi:TIR domain-containing protein [Leptospira santarosai]|uniref:TIR domain-containing protein n=1 Tax=Leptospira santarosai TaxID=28183 RepID=UPI0007740BA3|nr:hypothetical protein [Leptospira santarosai]
MINEEQSKTIKIFWSWQSDSPIDCNMKFIYKAIEKASKKLQKTSFQIFEIDRDTKGISGSPKISETILSKIDETDIFIWDATLCYKKPKPSPNPNVLFELGYALCAIGENRVIGIMNIANKLDGNALPFDLKNRRWPISYSLKKPRLLEILKKFGPYDFGFKKKKDEAQAKLITEIESAIKLCLESPKQYKQNQPNDYLICKGFYKTINSRYIQNWYNSRMQYPQYAKKNSIADLEDYCDLSELPENQFENSKLRNSHGSFIDQVKKYLYKNSIEMVPMDEDNYAVSTKVNGNNMYIENYQEKYNEQVNRIVKEISNVKTKWETYLKDLNQIFPEIIRENLN